MLLIPNLLPIPAPKINPLPFRVVPDHANLQTVQLIDDVDQHRRPRQDCLPEQPNREGDRFDPQSHQGVAENW